MGTIQNTRPVRPSPSPRAWRENILDLILAVSAPIGLAILAAMFVLNKELLGSTKGVVVALCVLVLVILRLAHGLSFGLRAGGWMVMLSTAAIASLALVGFAAGTGVLMAGLVVVGSVLFGRRAGLIFWGLNAVAFVGMGLLIDQGLVIPSLEGSDPRRLENWIRVGVSTTALIGLLATAIGYIIRQVETREMDLRQAYEQLQHLHRRLESAKEEERRFLSRELHDEFGQTLTALKLRLKLPTNNPGCAPDADMLALVDSLTARVRKISVDLRPALLDELGLGTALQAHVDVLCGSSGIPITLTMTGLNDRLPPELEIACFRVVQEAITNALRHGSPRTIKVIARRHEQIVSLRVMDDGIGFQPADRIPKAASAGHLGVVGMRERVRILGGEFNLQSQPGAGTTVTVDLPS